MSYFLMPDGLRIHYKRFGERDRPVVIFMHGLAADLHIWQPQIPEFVRDFQVFAFDFPGHGKSGRMPHYAISDLVRVLRELMDHLGVEKAHLVGSSIGCTVATLFAAEYPDSVRSIVLEGPVGGITPCAHPFAWLKYVQLNTTLFGVFLLWRFLGREKGGRVINWIGKTAEYAPFLIRMEEKVDPQAMVDLSFSNADAPYGDKLCNVVAPILIIRGINEQFPKRYAQYVKDNVAGRVLWIEIPQCHHLVALESPPEFNLASLAFLRQIEAEAVVREISEASGDGVVGVGGV